MTDVGTLPRETLSPVAALVDDVLTQYDYELEPAITAIDDAVPGVGGLFDPSTDKTTLRSACESVVATGPPADPSSGGDTEQLPAELVLYVDGSSRGNPGAAGAGAVLLAGEEPLCRLGRPVGTHTGNNVAEYAALQMGLAVAVHRYEPTALEVRIDSMTVVDDVWRGGTATTSFAPYDSAVAELLDSVATHRWTHLVDEDPNPADARATVGADIAALGP